MKVIHIKQSYRKSYSLQINRNGELVVKTNKTFSKFLLNQILEKHSSWIEKNLREFEEKRSRYVLRKFEDDEVFHILDEKYYLKFENSSLKNIKVRLEDYSIIVKVNTSHTKEEIRAALEKFFKRIAKEIFIERADYFCEIYGFRRNKISVKNQRSKWGSCSTRKNLNFNWKLIFAPVKVLDYVVIHEVCHLKELNHSKRFWELVESQCGNYKEMKKWLRKEGEGLQVGFEYILNIR